MIKNIFLSVVLVLIFGVLLYLFTPKSNYLIKDQGSVIKEMRSLSRFETSVFTIDKVISAGTNGNAFQQFLFGDNLLLIAHGQVIAGFDLANLSSNNVKVHNTIISVTLPPPQILVTSLDESKTQVYDRKTGLFTKGDKNLESKARVEAESTMKTAACDAGILTQAADNGRKQLTTLLTAFGYTEVDIIIPQGSCK